MYTYIYNFYKFVKLLKSFHHIYQVLFVFVSLCNIYVIFFCFFLHFGGNCKREFDIHTSIYIISYRFVSYRILIQGCLSKYIFIYVVY